MGKKYTRAKVDIAPAPYSSVASTENALMVCVTGQRSCERLIERAAQIRGKDQPFYIVHCVQTGHVFMNFVSDPDAIEFLFTCASLVDAELAILREDDVLDALVGFSQAHNVSTIVLGASPNQDGNSFAARFASRLGNVDFIIVD
jgi:K+-sensing histidine kinase KdpD